MSTCVLYSTFFFILSRTRGLMRWKNPELPSLLKRHKLSMVFILGIPKMIEVLSNDIAGVNTQTNKPCSETIMQARKSERKPSLGMKKERNNAQSCHGTGEMTGNI